jgi:hypothetical protein
VLIINTFFFGSVPMLTACALAFERFCWGQPYVAAFQVLPLVHAAVFPSEADAFGYEDEIGHINQIAERSGVIRRGASGGAIDLAVCVDAPSGGGTDGVMVMAGFWAARRCNASDGSSADNRESGSKACEFLSDVLFRCQTATEDAHDQHSFNIVLSQYSNRGLIHFAFLDSTLFLNGKLFAAFAALFFFLPHLKQDPLTLWIWNTCAAVRGVGMAA